MKKQVAIALASASILWPSVSQAAAITSAKVLRIVDGREVYINSAAAQVNQTAEQGSVLSTRKSRAELLFNTRAIGLLGKSSAIQIGAKCFRLESGVVVVNGTQQACLGSRVLGVKGTTYILAREEDSSYTVSVLAGEGVVSANEYDENQETNILSRYPTVSPSINLQAGGYWSAYPSGNGNFTGGISLYAPLTQQSARKIIYSSTSLGTTFENTWGVSTELGIRRFSASNQSTAGAYIGYSGYGSQGCYTNMINAGLQWEKSRWRIGGSGGVKVNDCPAGLNYGALNLSIPVGRIKEQPLYLSLSPYVLTGNVVSTDLLSSSDSSAFPGIRGSIEIPFSDRLSVRGYGGADSVFGVTIGGFFTYRIPTAGKVYNDPNTSGPEQRNIVSTAPIDRQPSIRSDESLIGLKGPIEIAQIATTEQGKTVSDLYTSLGINKDWQAQAVKDGIVKEGQRARFSPEGELLSVEPISNQEFLSLLMANLKGQNPLPESKRIASQAMARGLFSTQVAGFLGIDYLNNASQPISQTLDTPFSPLTQIPVGSYVCAATAEARRRGREEARQGQFNYSGGPAYFGKGSQTSQGYPATYNKNDAYVFANSGVCTELNRQANQGYDVVKAEQI